MIRALVWLFGVAMMAGIIHIVTVIGVPYHAIHEPWDELAAFGPSDVFVPLPRTGPGVKTLPGLDPAMVQTVCRFSLDKGPVRIRVSPPEVYWSLSLFDHHGLHVWGIDNRATGQRSVDLLVASDVQVAQLRENPPEELEDIVIVDWKSNDGIALVQVLVPQPSMEADIVASLGTTSCRPAPLN